MIYVDSRRPAFVAAGDEALIGSLGAMCSSRHEGSGANRCSSDAAADDGHMTIPMSEDGGRMPIAIRAAPGGVGLQRIRGRSAPSLLTSPTCRGAPPRTPFRDQSPKDHTDVRPTRI